jgi:8-oxo-dGTP diphosphatase
MTKLLTGVINVVVDGSKVLFLKRVKDPFLGYWALPGGKIEFGEHPEETALRELKEESGLDTDAIKMRGVISEVIKHQDTLKPVEHFVLFICEMKPNHLNLVESEEGELKWFDLSEITEENNIVPSDIKIINEMVLKDKTIPVHKSNLLKKDMKYIHKGFFE